METKAFKIFIIFNKHKIFYFYSTQNSKENCKRSLDMIMKFRTL